MKSIKVNFGPKASTTEPPKLQVPTAEELKEIRERMRQWLKEHHEHK